MDNNSTLTSSAITGTCLCSDVKFAFSPPAVVINNCHCSLCRKASGSAFGSYLHVPQNQFQWLAGKENINNYRPDGKDPRPFCKTCGCRTPILEDGRMVIPAGLLDDDPKLNAAVNIFAGSKAAWFVIEDSLPTFEQGAGMDFWKPFFLTHSELLKNE